jgi:hypothetical protein
MANEKNLKPFKKGNNANPNGRPKSIQTVIKDVFLEEHNIKLSKSQTEEMIKAILSKSKKELIELANNDDLPFWVAMIAKKASRDYEKGSIHLLEILWDRVYGKPQENIEANIETKTINLTMILDK